MENKIDIKNRGFIELMKFNYKNLHKSVCNCDKSRRTVTSIFIPIVSIILGYFIKEYELLLKSQTMLLAVVIELLISVWWLIMRILENYNNVKMKKLMEIEDIFNKQINNDT